MPFLPLDLLKSGAADLGVALDYEQCLRLDEFAELLVEANRSLNLTRIVQPRDIVTAHYLDSLACLAAAPVDAGAMCVDVGTGAGFPGIPIAVARPDITVTLMDSSLKKLNFAAAAAGKIGLTNVEPLHARAEQAGRDPKFRERWDVAWTRALAHTKVLVELCLPLVRVGGCLVAQKSRNAEAEIDEARALTGRLGGRIGPVRSIGIPHTNIVRLLLVVEKARQTPGDLPRSYSRIARGIREQPPVTN